MRRAVAGAFGALCLAAALAGVAAPAPLRVVATSTDLAGLADAVGGELVETTSLVPPASDPHALEIKPSHLMRLKRAEVLVRVGLDHEPWLEAALRAAGNALIARGSSGDVDASRGVRLLQSQTPRLRADARPHAHGLGNPHYWLDPENARPITAAILEGFARARPAQRATFAANRERFLARLDASLAHWLQTLAPWRGARAVAVHETWPYFASRFGLQVVAAAEPAPGVPPTPSELAALVERMRTNRVPLVIGEPDSDPALVARIAAGSGARPVTLLPSVGADAGARDFIGLFDVNVARLAGALSGR